MQSSNHIGKIVRNHADAVESGKISSRKRKAKSSGASFLAVPKHRAFIPMVTIWGGVLMALIMAVMPDYAIARVSSITGIYIPMIAARLILAVGVGLAGALLGFIVASALASYTKQKQGDDALVSKARKSREFEPINPASELGSESLDAPIESARNSDVPEPAPAAKREPTLGELEQRGYDIEAPEEFAESEQTAGEWAFTRKHFKTALIESCEGATCEAAPALETTPTQARPEPQEQPKAQSEVGGFASLNAEQITPQRRPLNEHRNALDLGGFDALPEQAAEAREQPQTEIQAPATALEALRQRPAGDLSLVEMVERFAAALHDHQAQERAQFEQKQEGRDAALAEALKALTLFTENGFDRAQPVQGLPGQIEQTEEELRSALSRLQGLRGAA